MNQKRIIQSQSLRDILLEELLDSAFMSMEADGMAVMFYYDNHSQVISHAINPAWNNNPPIIVPKDSSISHQCIVTGKTMIYENILKDKRISADLAYTVQKKFDIKAMICLPIIDLEGKPFASLTAYFKEELVDTERKVKLFKQFGVLTQTIISRRLSALDKKNISEITSEMVTETVRDIHGVAGALEGPTLYSRLLSGLLCVTQADLGYIGKMHYKNSGRHEMGVLAITNISNNEQQNEMYQQMMNGELTFPVKDNIVSQSFLTKETFICNDVANSEKFKYQPESHIQIKNFMSIPLWDEGDIRFIIGLGNRTGGFSCAIEESLQPVILAINTVLKNQEYLIANKKIVNALKYAHTRDELTEVSNRKGLELHLESLFNNENNSEATLCLIDIEEFSSLKRIYGEENSNQALVQIADRLRNMIRSTDHVARIANDRFSILLSGHRNIGVLERIMEKLEVPVVFGTDNIVLTLSMGASQIDVKNISHQKILDVTLSELKKAKDSPSLRISLSKISDEESLIARNLEMQEIDYAIQSKQFVLYAQPVVDILDNNRVEYFEILVRWEHPEKGTLTPSHFLPIIESDTSCMVRFDIYMITAILHVLLDREDKGLPLAKLSANITPETVISEAFESTIEYIAHLSDNVRHHFCFEVVECYIADSDDIFLARIRKLQKMGILIALDDFGTGYSNLSRLRDMPLDIIKIDRSFISTMKKGETDNLILTSMFYIGDRFGRTVIAEGVETECQLQRLKDIGCHYGQGYFFCHPQPILSVIDKTLF